MLKELTSKEVSEIAQLFDLYSPNNLLLEETATLIERGDKVIAKLKSTASGKCVNIYAYDKVLYRYILKYKVEIL